MRARLNPVLFDLPEVHLTIQLEEPLNENFILSRLKDIPAVDAVTMTDADQLKIDLVGTGAEELVIERLGGHAADRWVPQRGPQVSHVLDGLDTRILRQFRGQARCREHDLAREIHVTHKSVRSRLDKMAREGVFTIHPAALAPAPGVNHFLLTYEVEDRSNFLDQFQSLPGNWNWWFYEVQNRGRVLLSARNQEELEEVLNEKEMPVSVARVLWHRQLDQWVDPFLAQL